MIPQRIWRHPTIEQGSPHQNEDYKPRTLVITNIVQRNTLFHHILVLITLLSKTPICSPPRLFTTTNTPQKNKRGTIRIITLIVIPSARIHHCTFTTFPQVSLTQLVTFPQSTPKRTSTSTATTFTMGHLGTTSTLSTQRSHRHRFTHHRLTAPLVMIHKTTQTDH